MSDTKTEQKTGITDQRSATSDRPDPKESGTVSAAAAADGERALFDANALNAAPLTPTAEDQLGIERITGPALDNWQPSPSEATDEQKEAAKKRDQLFNEAKERRLNALQGQDVLPNNQADYGSQS